jgi:hypothetical protein
MKTVALPCRTGLAPIAALVLPAWLAAFPLGGWSADLPKQGTFTITYTIAGTTPASFDTGGGKWTYIFDSRLIATNDAGAGLFNNMSGHCIGSGMGGSITGYCLLADADGDKFVEIINRAAGAPKGTGTLTGGTGKYKGIEGSLEFQEGGPLADTAPGQSNLVGKKKGSYKIP